VHNCTPQRQKQKHKMKAQSFIDQEIDLSIKVIYWFAAVAKPGNKSAINWLTSFAGGRRQSGVRRNGLRLKQFLRVEKILFHVNSISVKSAPNFSKLLKQISDVLDSRMRLTGEF